MVRGRMTARAPRRTSVEAARLLQERLGGLRGVRVPPLSQLYRRCTWCTRTSSVPPPPPGHWTHCLRNSTAAFDLIFFGVPRNLHPAVFGARCAAAGVPGLAAGRFKREGAIVRLTLTDKRMILIIGKFGVGRFSVQLRRVCGWRCVVGNIHCSPVCVHRNRSAFVRAEGKLDAVLQQHRTAAPTAPPLPRGPQPTRGLCVGSWNVNKGVTSAEGAARQPVKAEELLHALRLHSMDIVAVQETSETKARRVQGDANYKWFTDPRQDTPAPGGLGFLVRDCGLTPYVTVGLPEATCGHCLWMKVDGCGRTPNLYIANVYLPVAGANNPLHLYREAVDSLLHDTLHFSTLGEVVLLGDFNTRLGKGQGSWDRVGQYGDGRDTTGETQQRAVILRDFLDAADMFALNDRQPTSSPAWTRVQQNGGETQRSILDYAIVGPSIISTSWQGQCFRVLPHDLPKADHRLLKLDLIAWGAATGRRCQRRRVFRWKLERLLAGGKDTIKERLELMQKYERKLSDEHAQFQAFAQQCLASQMAREEVAAKVAHRWEQVVHRCATATIGRRMVIPGVTKPWWDAELRAAVAARRAAHARWVAKADANQDPAAAADIQTLWARYLVLRRRCHRLVRQKQRAHHRKQGQELGRMLCHDPHNFWRVMNGMLGKRQGGRHDRVSAINDTNGATITNDAGIAKVFKTHYASLASPSPADLPPPAQQLRVDQQVQQAIAQATLAAGAAGGDHLGRPFDLEEIGMAMASLKNGKAVHDDGIPNELLKYGGGAMAVLLRTLYGTMLLCETVPDSWRAGTIINLYKSGETTNPGNYRGITLLSCVGKLFCRCISNRLAGRVTLHEGQSGFREGRSCIDNIYTLSETIRLRQSLQQPTYVFYLDIRKAFDSTWHAGMWSKLLDKGADGRLWRTIRNMYSKTNSRVLVNGILTDRFPINRGTAQGCTLSPLLFDIFVDGLLEAVAQAGMGVALHTNTVGGLMFADDFAGLESSPTRLQQLIDLVRQYCELWGLRANVDKSAIAVYAGTATTPPTNPAAAAPTSTTSNPHPHWTWGENPIPIRDSYKYLGVNLHSNGRWTAHVDQVIAKGAAALAKYSSYLRNRSLSRHVRLVLYKQYVRPVLEYGAEVWAPTQTQGKSLERIQHRAACMILGCFNLTAAVALRAELGLEPLAARRHTAKLRWYKCLRNMPPSRLPSAVYTSSQAISLPAARAKRVWATQVSDQWDSLRGIAAAAAAAPGAAPQQPPPTLPDRGLHDSYSHYGDKVFKAQARQLVQKAVENGERQEMGQRSTLQHLPHIQLHSRNIQPYLVHPYYRGLGSFLKMKCRTGTIQLNALLHARRQTDSAACSLCGQPETVNHFILHCPAYDEKRDALHQSLAALFPSASAYQQHQALPDDQQVANILSDQFWTDMQQQLPAANAAVCDFLEASWEDRSQYISEL